ncbi:hypothetical protein F4776DRAFT_373423 [Hypoxylon sp. NC0597]|nr:hypothetical protein F4776DRAFT_373423 [Hypoxylon sp. NC0597]
MDDTQSNCNVGIPHIGRLPCFGRIHTKSFPSTRTLDSKFLAEYHGELDSLRRQWETRVLDYWEAYWDKFYSIHGYMDIESSPPALTRPPQPSKPFEDCLRVLERNVQHLLKYLELKKHQAKAISCKRKIDVKYRSQLGMRPRKTSSEDFPIKLEEFACYWDPWHVTEPQPTPYMRSRSKGNDYIINEFYASDHELRLRIIWQKDTTGTIKTCLKPEDYEKLDVTTLYIHDS